METSRALASEFLELETVEYLMRQCAANFPFYIDDFYERITNIFSELKSIFGEKNIENLWKQIDIPFFLSFLFGTEECVKLRRGLGLLREMIFTDVYVDSHFRMISSGSLCEGVSEPSADDDIMVFFKSYLRVQQSYEDTKQMNGPLMLPSEYSAGYCLLLNVSGPCYSGFITIINKKPYISSTLFKETFKSVFSSKMPQIHGPCIMHTTSCIPIDVAWCLICPFWPSVANEWISRDRYYEWPSPEMIQRIVRSGCHVVPIGEPDSVYRDHEWRISFSLAERTLVHSFNHAQFLTYNLLRFALKKVIDKQFPGVLCSYFIKTTLFHAIERTSRQMWRVDNLEICYVVCLALLYCFIDNKNCPNYFISKYNIIKRNVDVANKQQLLNLIAQLIKIRISGVLYPDWLLANYSKSLHLKFSESKRDIGFFNSYQVSESACPLIPEKDNSPSFDRVYISSVIRMLRFFSQEMETQNGFLNTLLHSGIMYLCQSFMDHLWSSTKKNKKMYILHKTIETLLHVLVHGGNLTTGKLTTALYMYLVGKTNLGLLVIQKLLTKYPPHAIGSTFSIGELIRYNLAICNLGYTLDYKARRAWAPHFKLQSNDLNSYPSPMKIWISTTDEMHLQPLTFALFLESLGNIELKDIRSLIQSTKRLLKHLGHLDNIYDIACTKMCKAIIKFEQGDGQSAYKWFRSVYMTEDRISPFLTDSVRVSALMYIACLIYSHLFLPNSNLRKLMIVPTDLDLD